MKRIIFIILGSINICLAYAQSFNGQYISEWQWDMNKNTNLINQLRLELSVPIGKGKDSFEVATLHVAKTNDGIIDDWQGFSNIDADNNFAMLAVLGYLTSCKSHSCALHSCVFQPKVANIAISPQRWAI